MNINHSTINGNLTRDPEMRTVGADKSVVSFTIACNSKYKASDGEQREEVTFIDIEVWGRQGEIAAQFCTKGTMVLLEGRLKQDNWTDKEGHKRSKLKLVADRVHLFPRTGNRTAPASDDTVRPAPAPTRPAQGPGAGDDEPPFARSDLEL